MKATIMIF